MTLRAPLRGLAPGARPAPKELAHYVCTVHRLALGDGFVVFDPEQATEADARLEQTEADLVLHVGALRTAARRATRPVILVQGLAKGDKCDAIVRDATELGATAVVLTVMARSVARPSEGKHAAREERWRKIATEAARQSGRGDAPAITFASSLERALDDVPEGATRFLLWEKESTPLAPHLLQALAGDRPLAFVVGPEGGVDDAEVVLCQARGFESVSIGPFTLRTETVAAAVLGAVRIFDPGRG